jgi:DNA protecting protein DprA
MGAKSIPAVAYYRMSTDRQETSIPDQTEGVEKLARNDGYQIIRVYKDEGISGDDTEKRTGFRAMIADAERLGDFQAVLCWDQDRFGRFDPLEAGYWIKPLRDAGVYLHTVAQGKIDWEDFAGRIVYAVQQEGKHAFLRDMSRNTIRGMLAKAKRGLWLGGTIPYGYVLNDHKRLVPGDLVEVETVRWLFASYATRDTSLKALAIELNRLGVPAPGGRKGRTALWCPTAVQKIVTRPTYLGDTVWNRRHEGKYHEVRGGEFRKAARQRGVRGNAPGDWIVCEGTHEALVDRATFDRVAMRLIERRDRHSPVVASGAYLFTGLLRCAHCGWPMHGCSLKYTRRGRSYRYRRYICGNYNLHGSSGCKCNTVMEGPLAGVVLRMIREKFLAPENLAALRAEIRRQEEAERSGREAPAAVVDRQITELTRKIDQGTEKWLSAPPSLTTILGEKLEQWRAEREALQARRRELAKPAVSTEDLDAAVERIAGLLHDLPERLAELDPADVREVFRELVERIDLWFRHVPYGTKRERSVLERGVIHLRPELVCADVIMHDPRGLARGVDGVAHRAALQAGGRTIAVLAGGLSRIYPPEHTDLAAEVKNAGALLSEAPMATEPLAALFPPRNRIISGLSQGVIVVEASERSGTLITARHAAEQGREVFAVPGPVDSPTSAGCLHLIREGATLIRGVDDVLEALSASAPVTARKVGQAVPDAEESQAQPDLPPTPPPPELDGIGRRVWDFLADAPRHVDAMAQELGVAVPELSRTLMLLEMKKVIRRLPGNQYERR